MARMPPDAELRFHRFRAALQSLVRDSRDVNRTLRAALRESARFFEAPAACLAVYRPGDERAEVRAVQTGRAPNEVSPGEPSQEGPDWDAALLTAILRRESPSLPPRFLYGLLHRRGRIWGLMAVRRQSTDFAPWHLKALQQTANTVSDLIEIIDRRLLVDVRERIDRKIMDRLRPRDLFYQILDGLRSLTRYDHSAAILVVRPADGTLELAAEQIAWRKDVSRRIGQRLPLTDGARAALAEGRVQGFSRAGHGWEPWTDRAAAASPADDSLARLLDYNVDPDPADFLLENGVIAAPLTTRAGVIGILKVASRHPEGLGPYEADLVQRFLPQAAVAMQRSELKRAGESMQAQILAAERRGAMALLARGVAHDVNNTLGGILLGVQQARSELEEAGTEEAARLARMLSDSEKGLHACRRIFGGMLAFARGQTRAKGRVLVARALREALDLHAHSIRSRGIRLNEHIDEDLPVVAGRQSDLAQVFMNLVANALDAMSDGGTLEVRAGPGGEGGGDDIAVLIRDDGEGIPPEEMERIQDAFYTTKEQGHGLGLAIVRSLLTEFDGSLRIVSEVGSGTTVTVLLPALEEER